MENFPKNYQILNTKLLEKSIEILERINYGRHFNDEELDMIKRTQLTKDETDYILGYKHNESITKNHELLPGKNELTDLSSAFPTILEVEADENFMKTFSKQGVIYFSVLGCIKC